MTKQTLIAVTFAAASCLYACKESTKQENMVNTTTEASANTSDNIVNQSISDKNGNTLELTFDNNKDNVTINFMGETSELQSQKPASGIWYKNEHYELSGKGNDITLLKDGNIVFEHKDDKVDIEAKNDNGDVLNMNFNNTEGTVKAYLNGGEQIDLVEQKSASGIWYKNDHYELLGKGDHYELIKDGTTVFKN